MNIILIGFRCTGKTTIGKKIACALKREFIDADEYLEQKEGRTIRDIFHEGGEKLFRKLEAKIIAELCCLDNKVIATGGGAVLLEENVKNIKKNGIIILLEADVRTIYERISSDTNTKERRPKLTEYDGYQEVEYLLDYRRPFYRRAADVILNTANVSISESVNRIVDILDHHMKDSKGKPGQNKFVSNECRHSF